MLRISNVCKAFGDILVLNNVSLAIERSNIVGLAGPSGGGKSTLLRCMQRLETIDSGTIECSGNTGFMFQDFQLFPHMTVMQNLTYAPKLRNGKGDHDSTAMSMLKNLGIAGKANEYPARLSGGQKQRVALARSLIMGPEILLCDEPTSGLDVATIEDVVLLLKSVREMGVAMIIASHDLDFLVRIADRIVLLRGGEIVVDIEPGSMADPIGALSGYYVNG